MRIARFAAPEGPRFALADSTSGTGAEAARWLDLGLATPDLQRALLSGTVPGPGEEIWPELPLMAPVQPQRVFAVGRNYRAHAKERGDQAPRSPVIWVKLNSAVSGSGAAIPVPEEHAHAIDYEGELAVVIGRPGRRISPAQALAHVAGYTIANDVTARDAQDLTTQYTLPKSLPGFAPLGPHLVTSDEVPDPRALVIETLVDGKRRQHGRTKDMIFSVATLVSFISGFVELEPGDVIETGTPSGVGWHRDPPATLQVGQVVEVRIEPLGTLRNPVRKEGESGPGD